MKRFLFLGSMLFSVVALSQTIENAQHLNPFIQQLKENKKVTNILFLGDSHIQSGWITGYLRKNFQAQYGNAGRGLVFPYTLANSNGPDDFQAYSNQTWETFRLVYEQDVFPQMGASGFVMGNHENSLVQIQFKNPEDTFDKVLIFHDPKMKDEKITLYNSDKSLQNYITKKVERVNYQVKSGDTFPELASKFYTITTKLLKLNGAGTKKPKEGTWIKADKVSIEYHTDFDTLIKPLTEVRLGDIYTEIDYTQSSSQFLMRTNTSKGNIFYGFQFLKNADKGVVFNTVGVNGVTYADFMKYPIQTQQLKTLSPDVIMIALGTNESLSTITEQEFSAHAIKLINEWRKENPNMPILLISPTDNKLKPQRAKEISQWIKRIADTQNVAFLNLYQEMGGAGYFAKALSRKEANADGVHFLKTGYERQAEVIWKALEKLLK